MHSGTKFVTLILKIVIPTLLTRDTLQLWATIMQSFNANAALNTILHIETINTMINTVKKKVSTLMKC